MRRFFFVSHSLTFLLSTLIAFLASSSPAAALRIIVQPQATIGAAATVFWVRETSDPTPLFDLRFVIHGEGRDDGLAGANIPFTDNTQGGDGIRNVGRQVVQFPRAGRYVLVAVSGPENRQIGTSNEVVVTPGPPIVLSTSPSASGTPTNTPTPAPTDPTPAPSATRQDNKNNKNKTSIVVGAVIGALLFLAIVAVIILWLIRRRRIQADQERLSFHPDQMFEQRRSRWMSISRFSVSRGGGARAPAADRADALEANRSAGDPDLSDNQNPFADGERVDSPARTGIPSRTPGRAIEVVFDANNHRQSAVSTVRSSQNSFSTESQDRSRWSGDTEAVHGAGLSTVAKLLIARKVTLAKPSSPTTAPLRTLPPIPSEPKFDEDSFSDTISINMPNTPNSEVPPTTPAPPISARGPAPATPAPSTPGRGRTPATPAFPTSARGRTPATPGSARAMRPLPTPAIQIQSATTSGFRSLPPVPTTAVSASALPFPPSPTMSPTQQELILSFPMPTHYGANGQVVQTPVHVTPRQQLIERRLSQVKTQLSLLNKKIQRDQVDRAVGQRVRRDLENQYEWLAATMVCPWAKDMVGSDEVKPDGWSRYMTP